MQDILEIIQEPDPVLRQVSEPVVNFDQELMTLAKLMVSTMAYNKGVGLSAIQVKIPLRIFVAVCNKELFVMANPVFLRKGNREVTAPEGCLSLLKYPAKGRRLVSRPAKCELEWQDLAGNKQQGNFSGDHARIFQHEIDHLDGILILDKPVIK